MSAAMPVAKGVGWIKSTVRTVIRRLFKSILRCRSSPLKLQPGTVVVVAPHQDDASFGCGALIAELREKGERVQILYLTDGSNSHPGHPLVSPEQLARLRKGEALQAKARLGVPSECLHFFDLPDGRLNNLGEKERSLALEGIRGMMMKLLPTTLLLPSRNDGSTEHEAAFALANEVLSTLPFRPRVLEYAVWSMWSPSWMPALLRQKALVWRFDSPAGSAAKDKAMDAYASQLRPLAPWTVPSLPEGFREAFSQTDEYYFESE